MTGGDKSFIVGAVFFCGLGHETNIRHRAHGLGIEGPVLFAKINRGLVDPGIAAIRNYAEGVLGLASGVPHLARSPDHRGHGGIDNDIARYVQIGDAFIGIDHGDRWPSG